MSFNKSFRLGLLLIVLFLLMVLCAMIYLGIRNAATADEWMIMNDQMGEALNQAEGQDVSVTKQQKSSAKITDAPTEGKNSGKVEAGTAGKAGETAGENQGKVRSTADSAANKKIEPPVPRPSSQGLININEAAPELLEELPGIGPSKARAIADYRNNVGKFTTIEDIILVKGIGPKLFEKMKNLIVVD